MEINLLKAFEASLIPNNESLKQVNEYLESIKTHENCIQATLHISLSNHPLEIRQMAVIYLKNITRIWKDSRRDFVIPPSSKSFLREHVIECLLFSIPDRIRSQFEEIAFNIAKVDFPWDNILVQIENYLVSNNADQIFAGLSMINQISKVYEQVLNERRNNMRIIVSKFFTQLGVLLESLLQEESPTKFKYIGLILEIYWTCFYIDLPEEQANIPALHGWLMKCKTVLDLDMHELEALTNSEEEEKNRESHPKWICKKWSAQIIHRFFNRYFNVMYLKDQNKFIGEYFQANWALPLSELALKMLLKHTTHYVSGPVSNYLLKFLGQAFKLNSTLQVLGQYNSQIINLIILPLLSRKPSDEELWISDPVEYIRREADIGRAYYSPKCSAIDLLIIVCESSALHYFMNYMVEVLKSSPSLLVKESLMFALGSLNKVLKTEKSFLEHLEDILFNYVLQEFESPIGFLRSRACWVYSKFTDLPFKIPTHQESILSNLCRLMLDTALPVRIEAATALPKILNWPVSQQKIGSEINNVLTVYLELMNQIDSEDLVEALEDIVENFSNEIIPFALEFIKRLVSVFLTLIEKESSNESIMAAITTLNTVSKIVDALDDNNHDLLTITCELYPVFDFAFAESGNEYFECTIPILNSLLYYSPSNFLPNLFKYASMLKAYFIENGEVKDKTRDHIEEAFAPMANFLQKYQNLAIENLGVFMEFASVLSKEGYQETVTGCKIFMAILENFINLDQSVIVQVITNSYCVFTSQESKKLKMLFVQIVFVGLWRNPSVTFACLRSLACISDVFTFLKESHTSIKEEIPLTQSLLGLSNLMTVYREFPEFISVFVDMFHVLILLAYRKSYKSECIEAKGQEPDHLNMLTKLKAMQNEEGFDDGGGELYESAYEVLDWKKFVKHSILNAQEFIANIALSPEEKSILDQLN